jgi:hypothetical protein
VGGVVGEFEPLPCKAARRAGGAGGTGLPGQRHPGGGDDYRAEGARGRRGGGGAGRRRR